MGGEGSRRGGVRGGGDRGREMGRGTQGVAVRGGRDRGRKVGRGTQGGVVQRPGDEFGLKR